MSALPPVLGEEAGDLFLVLSLKWAGGEKVTWWGPNNAGYFTDLAAAGRYTRAEIEAAPGYYNNGTETIAIPLKAAERFAKTHVYVPRLRSVMQTLRRARSRAALAHKARGQ